MCRLGEMGTRCRCEFVPVPLGRQLHVSYFGAFSVSDLRENRKRRDLTGNGRLLTAFFHVPVDCKVVEPAQHDKQPRRPKAKCGATRLS